MKTTVADIKKQEARQRMAALRQLRTGQRSAAELQREASLVVSIQRHLPCPG